MHSLHIYFCVLPVVVMYEECGDAIEIGAALSSPTTHLLPLPCGGGELQELPSSFSSLPPSPPVVVIASCPVIARVTTRLGPNNTVLGWQPSIILPVPVAHSPSCLAHRQATGVAAVPVTDPVDRALNLLLSWMTYHSWKTLNVLYDRSLDPSTFAFFREYISAYHIHRYLSTLNMVVALMVQNSVSGKLYPLYTKELTKRAIFQQCELVRKSQCWFWYIYLRKKSKMV